VNPSLLWNLQLATTWAMVGIIWQVQLVTYPAFLQVGRSEFRDYHNMHAGRIAGVVGPLMAFEGLTAALLLTLSPTMQQSPLFWISLLGLVVNWVSTLFIQVPLHSRLENSYDTRMLRQLVLTNWIRTVSWTLRGLCLLFI
jgi:hypothetical protein